MKTMTASSLKQCLLRYIATGWSGVVPESCRGTVVLVPANVGPWLWGWPHRFVERMRQAGSEVFVLGPWGGDGFSSGIDHEDQLRALPAGYAGGIWTNRVDIIAPLVQKR
jgi:glycerophosphoryl diester phosphodiesterase